MFQSAPYSPFVYWPHVFFGIGSALLVLIPILAAKGSLLHRRSGQLFAIAMGVAAVSAIAFSFVRPAPMALFSAVNVIYGIGAGILALRPRAGRWRVAEYVLAVIPLLLVLFAAGMTVMTAITAPQLLLLDFVFSGLVVSVFGYFVWTDFRYFRASEITPFNRYRRHAVRMALAASETVRAPLISFGPPVFGALTVPIYFIGPFILIPAIYFLALPGWVKRGEIQKAKAIQARQDGGTTAQSI